MTNYEGVELYIAPCSREHKEQTYRYFRETVLNPVSPDHFEPLREAGFETLTSIWGVVSGNQTHWESIDQGDVQVFYTKSGTYTHAAVVTDTEENQQLAEELWEPYDGAGSSRTRGAVVIHDLSGPRSSDLSPRGGTP